jgi:hypothetical protein
LFFLILPFLGNTLSRSSRVLPSKSCKVVLIPLLCVITVFFMQTEKKKKLYPLKCKIISLLFNEILRFTSKQYARIFRHKVFGSF